jgi:hypothetical protein
MFNQFRRQAYAMAQSIGLLLAPEADGLALPLPHLYYRHSIQLFSFSYVGISSMLCACAHLLMLKLRPPVYTTRTKGCTPFIGPPVYLSLVCR